MTKKRNPKRIARRRKRITKRKRVNLKVYLNQPLPLHPKILLSLSLVFVIAESDDEVDEEEDGLVRVVAAGQLSVLCLLIERGRIPNSSSTTSSLVYDIIPQSEFER